MLLGAPASSAAQPAVVERRVIGQSVQGRDIVAYRLGEAGKPRVVLISTMHGNERDTRSILGALRDGPRIRGVDLWVLPTYNPDGYALGTRQNARGVDLNRNYPKGWIRQGAPYDSGPRAQSEPETRAVMRFLLDVNPSKLLSFHQPLYGVDTDTKSRWWATRVAEALQLPEKRFTCNNGCHGTMTMWFNAKFRNGYGLTVEYGRNPSRTSMTSTAPRQVLGLLGGRRGY